MAVSSRYYEAPDGRHFNYNVHPTFICPLADPVRYEPEVGDGEHVLKDECAPRFVAAALALGLDDGVALARMVRKAHQAHGKGGRRHRDADGKLTDRCDACGGPMDRLGFRIWTDAPIAPDEATEEDRVSSRFASRMGFAPPMRTTYSGHVDTKREAKAWALENFRMAQAAAAEVA